MLKLIAGAFAIAAVSTFAMSAQAADIPLPAKCTIKCAPKVIHAPHRVEMKAPPPKTVVVRQDVYVVTKPRIHYAPPPVVYVQPPPPVTYEWPEVVHVPPPPPPRIIRERPCRPCMRDHVFAPCYSCEHRVYAPPPCTTCGAGIREWRGGRVAEVVPQRLCRPGFHQVPPPPGHRAWCMPDR